MERFRKHSDESALVKAAAWAWYEHGTGLEGMSQQEFDVRRNFHDAKPSRFKLEAKKPGEHGGKDFDQGLLSPRSTAVPADDRSLLDRYEIESISRRLDQLIESSGDKGTVYTKGLLVKDGLAHSTSNFSPLQNLQAPTLVAGDVHGEESAALSDSDYKNRGRKKKSNNFIRGFWQRHVVICGSSAHKDVILGTKSFVDNREQQQYPEKGRLYSPIPVVKLANCRRRITSRHDSRLVIN